VTRRLGGGSVSARTARVAAANAGGPAAFFTGTGPRKAGPSLQA